MNNPVLLIKHWRKRRELSQEQLAHMADISKGYLSELESGIKSPTLRMLFKITGVLEVCPRNLLPCNGEYCVFYSSKEERHEGCCHIFEKE